MRSFGPVDDKLEEAHFFLEELAASEDSWHRTRFLFSAFVSSARSVTFALQASLSDAPGFPQWYTGQQDGLKQNKLARFFHECRTDSQHLGLNPVRFASSRGKKTLYFFGQPDLGRYEYLPNDDVLTSSQSHMRLICSIIDQTYEKFGLLIDPDQIYTPEGLLQLSKTIEDVEEEIGFPRGYTDIPLDGPDKDRQRLSLLRRNIPGSNIKPLLAKYLGRELSYPCRPFTAA